MNARWGGKRGCDVSRNFVSRMGRDSAGAGEQKRTGNICLSSLRVQTGGVITRLWSDLFARDQRSKASHARRKQGHSGGSYATHHRVASQRNTCALQCALPQQVSMQSKGAHTERVLSDHGLGPLIWKVEPFAFCAGIGMNQQLCGLKTQLGGDSSVVSSHRVSRMWMESECGRHVFQSSSISQPLRTRSRLCDQTGVAP